MLDDGTQPLAVFIIPSSAGWAVNDELGQRWDAWPGTQVGYHNAGGMRYRCACIDRGRGEKFNQIVSNHFLRCISLKPQSRSPPKSRLLLSRRMGELSA